MVVLGLLLLLASGAVVAGVVHDNTDTVSASAYGLSLTDVTLGGLFLLGALAGLVFALGLVLFGDGLRRGRRRRVASRRAVRDERTEKEKLADENAALRAQLNESEPYPAGTADDRVAPAYDSRYDSAARYDEPADVAGRHERRGLFRR